VYLYFDAWRFHKLVVQLSHSGTVQRSVVNNVLLALQASVAMQRWSPNNHY
jgi:hypothetical protein